MNGRVTSSFARLLVCSFARLLVSLGDVPVGPLSIDRNGAVEFRWLGSYQPLFPRPVPGLQFLDEADAVQRSRSRVPSWFSNLLPEGALRELIAKQAGIETLHEYALLNVLGQDLPGAVRVRPAQAQGLGPDIPASAETGTSDPSVEDDAWHFSLAGVQLKFSGLRTAKSVTIPVSGLGDDWIIKLPETRFGGVPANEFATMAWAQASGIETPETALVALADIVGLPASAAPFGEIHALAVKRFDRPRRGHRVHSEDLAQVLGAYPADKYQRSNYETVGSIVLALSGIDGLRDYVRRLVFVVASGNGDAHLKNWSLIYPAGVAARLSPAYDQVSTIQYIPGDKLALTLGRSKRRPDVTLAVFQRLARKLNVDEHTVRDAVDESVPASRQAWHAEGKAGCTAAQQQVIESRWRGVPLFGWTSFAPPTPNYTATVSICAIACASHIFKRWRSIRPRLTPSLPLWLRAAQKLALAASIFCATGSCRCLRVMTCAPKATARACSPDRSSWLKSSPRSWLRTST